jgi:hypothetical protein
MKHPANVSNELKDQIAMTYLVERGWTPSQYVALQRIARCAPRKLSFARVIELFWEIDAAGPDAFSAEKELTFLRLAVAAEKKKNGKLTRKEFRKLWADVNNSEILT